MNLLLIQREYCADVRFDDAQTYFDPFPEAIFVPMGTNICGEDRIQA